MSPEIFPMFIYWSNRWYYLYRFNSTQQLSRCIVLLCIVLALTFCCFIHCQQKQIAGYRSQFFVKHSEEYQVNIRAKVNIQTCIKRSLLGNSLLTALTNLKVIQCRWWKSEISPTTNWPQTVHHYLFRDRSLFMGMTGSGKNRTGFENFSGRGDGLCVFFLNKETGL